MANSREQVLDLSSDDMGSKFIGPALSELGHELAREYGAALRVTELGTPQSLHPMVVLAVLVAGVPG